MGRPKGSKNKTTSSTEKKPGKTKGKLSFFERSNALIDGLRTSIDAVKAHFEEAAEKESTKELADILGFLDVAKNAGDELELVVSALPADFTPGEEKPLEWVVGAKVQFKAAFSKAFQLHDEYEIEGFVEMGKGPGMGTHVRLAGKGIFAKAQLELTAAPVSTVKPPAEEPDEDFEDDVPGAEEPDDTDLNA